MANLNKGGMFYWIGGAAILSVIALAVLPKLLGKSTVVTAPSSPITPVIAPGGQMYNMDPADAAMIRAAKYPITGQDYGVANSQYGNLRNYNFAGLALEAPTNVMPLGFHLNNVY